MSDNLHSNYQGVWDSRIGFGDKAALISIDFMQGYTDKASPLFAQGVGEILVAALLRGGVLH